MLSPVPTPTRLTWIPMQIQALRDDIELLSNAATAAYTRLMVFYADFGRLPEGDVVRARLCRMSLREYRAIKPEIAGFFPDDPTPGHDVETGEVETTLSCWIGTSRRDAVETYAAKRESARAAGQASAKARQDKAEERPKVKVGAEGPVNDRSNDRSTHARCKMSYVALQEEGFSGVEVTREGGEGGTEAGGGGDVPGPFDRPAKLEGFRSDRARSRHAPARPSDAEIDLALPDLDALRGAA